MARKYKFAGETKKVDGRILHRIRAVRDVGSIAGKGELGGWIESEKNLAQYGDCWVCGNAMVYDNARVCDTAKVCDNARVCENALVCGRAEVRDDALVCGCAGVYDDAQVYDGATIGGCASVYGNAVVKEHAVVYSASVYGDATVCGFATVDGRASICGKVVIEHSYDYAVFKNTWSSMRFFTYTRPDHMWCVGCFRGTGKELIERAYEDGMRKGKCYEATVRYVEQIEAIMAEGRKRSHD